MKLAYPNTRTVEQTDDYHGTLVPDPYRWLEEVDRCYEGRPATELGREEWEYFESRGERRTRRYSARGA